MKIARWGLMLWVLSCCVFAQSIEIIGTMHQVIVPREATQMTIIPDAYSVTLSKVTLSPFAQKTIAHRVMRVLNATQPSLLSGDLSRQVQLGMNQVPVLNQGPHGTSTTFANTAAIDAILGKGDYISELCLLQLGLYLENNAYMASGWSGTYAPAVLNQIQTFGIISKDQQLAKGCGGVKEYPLMRAKPETDMSVVEFRQLSEPISKEVIAWTSILDIYQLPLDRIDTSKTLREVKTALQVGDRVTFGVLLPDVGRGIAGAVGKYHVANDTWVLTPEIAQEVKTEREYGSHEMVITGYDDDAEALDTQGRRHQGLFTLRNSWGAMAGDSGDFYMSFDYFKALVIEAQRIRSLKKQAFL